MDVRLRRSWLVGLALIAGLLAVPGVASASHFRSANLNWEEAGAATDSGQPVRFNATLSYKWSNTGQPQVGDERTIEQFNFGDGSVGVSPTFRVTFVNQAEDYYIAEAIEGPGSTQRGFLHTYAQAGPFTANFSSCCTIGPPTAPGGHDGLSNAANGGWAVNTLVNLAADDESPKTSLPPVVALPEGGVQTFNVPANDAGGESIRYRLTRADESCANCADPHPPGLTIDEQTGQVSWDTTGRHGLWYSGVVVEAVNALGSVVSSTQVNYVIRVGGEAGNNSPVWEPPTPADGTEFTVTVGQTLTFGLQASDPDNDTVSILKNSGPGSVSAVNGDPATATFSYTPTSSEAGTSQIVQFIAQDDGSPPLSPPFRSYTINVVASSGDGGGTTTTPPKPPPATLTLTPSDATRTVGESHTVMAHAENGSGTVRFFVNGSHSLSGTTPTNAAGDALFSYPGTTTGGDRIFAYLDLDGNGVQNSDEPGASAAVSWHPPPQQPEENQLPPSIITADSIDALPNPQPYKTANIEPRGGGEVYVQLPDREGGASASQAKGAPRGFIPLRTAAQVPLGTVIEATKGRVAVESTSANTSRRVQDAEFFSGRFQMVQRALNNRRSRPVTEMVLKGGSRRGCPGSRRVRSSGVGAKDSARRRSARSRVRRLWGRGRGRFRTRGRYSSATVRGTTWLVEDRCGGTLTRLPRRPANSRVEVRDFLQRRTIQLRAGRSYFARGSSKR